jgi:hypothetical protein
MNAENSIITRLNKHYFWDIDPSGLDENSSCRLIIERVFTLGEIYEMNQVVDFYGRKKVVDILCHLPYLDSKTLNFISKLFHKPVKSFRCYQLKQLRPQYWNS